MRGPSTRLRAGRSCQLSLLFLQVLLHETVAAFLILVLRNYKCRNILFLLAEILRVSVSQAKRVVIIPTFLKYLDASAL